MDKTEWILCPLCGSKTRNKVRQETLIEAKNLQVTVIKEPDTLDAEPMNV